MDGTFRAVVSGCIGVTFPGGLLSEAGVCKGVTWAKGAVKPCGLSDKIAIAIRATRIVLRLPGSLQDEVALVNRFKSPPNWLNSNPA